MTHRILSISDNFDYVVLVSEEDYVFLTRWRWTFKRSTRRYDCAIYACRNTWRDGVRIKIMMHNVILKRMGKERPSRFHTADHANRQTLDNRRVNLAWATKKQQRRNRRDNALRDV